MPNRFAPLAGLSMLILLGAPAGAVNLLTNGDFATGIGGWTLSGGGTAGFVPIDAGGDPLSGSLGLSVVTSSALPVCESATQCVPVTANTSYALSGRSRSDQNQISAGNQARATIQAGYFDGAGCTGNLVGSPIATTPSNLIAPNASWNAGTSAFAPAPPAAVSALIVLGVCVGSVDGQQTAILPSLFDDIVFSTQPSAVEVPTLGGAGLAALAILLLAAALRAVRDRNDAEERAR